MLAQDLKSTKLTPPVIIWEKLPDDFVLPDDPVDNINQNAIANALSTSIRLAGLLGENALTCTDYGMTVNVNGKTIAKAPDWAYVANITVPRKEIERSYTPHLQGDVPTIVIEVLSATDGGEYSKQLETPMGKWYFYEQILKVPYYGIFEPESGDFEVYRLNDSGIYVRLPIEESGRYWIAGLDLEIGAWKGSLDNRYGYWLRLWYANGVMLPWDTDIKKKLDTTEQELAETKQRLSKEQERAARLLNTLRERDRLIEQLRALGIDAKQD
jgi:Putative restriction endonuclease